MAFIAFVWTVNSNFARSSWIFSSPTCPPYNSSLPVTKYLTRGRAQSVKPISTLNLFYPVCSFPQYYECDLVKAVNPLSGHLQLFYVFKDSASSDQLVQIRPVCRRQSGGFHLDEIFVDDLFPSLTVPKASCSLVEAYPSQRIIQNRVENPHGEESENCWVLEEDLPNDCVVNIR